MENVVVSRSLLNDTVTLARETETSVIISGPSSPFCHAANALRVLACEKNPIEWWASDSTDFLPSKPEHVLGHVNRSAARFSLMHHEECGGVQLSIDLRDPWGLALPAMPLIASAPTGSWSAVVGMSGRCYDRLTASIMVPGLSDSARWLSGRETPVARAESGHLLIWNEAIRSDSMVELLADLGRSDVLLKRQALEYGELMREWISCRDASSVSVEDLEHSILMLRRFFGLLLLLHTSYTRAISQCLARISGSESADAVAVAVAVAAVPQMLRWQIAEPGLLPAFKDLFEPGSEFPYPAFTIEEDLASTFGQILAVCGTSHREWCLQLARISVLKEWKFFLSKALHRHFGILLRALMGVSESRSIPNEAHLRGMLARDLLVKLEEENSVVRGQSGQC